MKTIHHYLPERYFLWLIFLITAFFLLFPHLSRATGNEYGNVYVGVYLSDISNFDVKEGRFKADFYLWCKWLGPEEIPDVEVANGELESLELLAREDEGDWHSVRWRAQGTIRGTFPLQKFPFDQQTLSIQINLPGSQGNIIPDLAGSGMSDEFSITGWNYKPFFAADIGKEKYYSDFGSIAQEGKPYPVNYVNFNVEISRPFFSYIVKFVLPLAIIIMLAVLAFFLPASMVDARSALGVTALLSVVAFQFTMSDSIPDVSYLVTADKLFMAAYAIVLLANVVTVVTFNIFEKNPQKANLIDRISYIVIPISFVVLGFVVIRQHEKEKQEIVPEENFGTKSAIVHTSKKSVRILNVFLKHLNTQGIRAGLLTRGLFTVDTKGNRTPHLLQKIPSLTNDLVKFLPDGGMTVTWRIRPGLAWGDGCPLTSQDIAFSAGLKDNPDRREVRIIDGITIEIEWDKRIRVAVEKFDVFPVFYFEDVAEDSGMEGIWEIIKMNPPPMDGPYVFRYLEPKKEALFVRNPYFAGPAPAIDSIFIVGYKEKGTVFADAFAENQFDIATNVSVKSFNSTLNDPHSATLIQKDDYVNFLQPDLSIPAFQNLEFRQAIIHALNKQAISDLFYGKEGRVAHSYYDISTPEFPHSIKKYDYDPLKARALLLKSGFKNYPMKLITWSRGEGKPEHTNLIKVYNDLKAAGFNVILDARSKSVMKLWKTGDHGGLLLYGRRDPQDPARFWNLPYDEANTAFFANQPIRLFDSLEVDQYKIIKNTLYEERRIAVSREMQKAYAEKLPTIPLAIGVYRTLYNKDLHGIDIKGGSTMWWNVEEWYFEESVDSLEMDSLIQP